MTTITNNVTVNRGHNARYFFDLVREYRNDRRKFNHWRGDLANGWAEVHHINGDDTDTAYSIDENGTVTRRNMWTDERDYEYKGTVDDLQGDDFEFASTIFIYKCGYITLDSPDNASDKQYAKKILSLVYSHIASMEPDWWERREGERNYPLLCGASSWTDGITEEFSYYATNGIELHIQSIHEFCKDNENRKAFEVKAIPFIKNINGSHAFHITMVDFNRGASYDQKLKECNQALKEFMDYLNAVLKSMAKKPEAFEYVPKTEPHGDATAKWINTKLNAPLFWS